MRALGPGSVSSILKIILDVVYIVLWVVAGALALSSLIAVLLSFNPEILADVVARAANGEELSNPGPVLVAGSIAGALYAAVVLVIVERLRKIFATLTAGDPFHPDNVLRLRFIGLMLAVLELGRSALLAVATRVFPGQEEMPSGFSPTAWFSVLVVFVLAEVFREGARLRREAELTI